MRLEPQTPSEPISTRQHRLGSPQFFLLWLVVFYTGWMAFVSVMGAWGQVASHWPIALAMALGSYFAGSTPMGGGTVGFPVLTLLFDLPASLGRDFGLAVQSIGMVSASIFILTRRQTVDWALLRPALVGAALGTPFGAFFIAPHAPDLLVKLVFALVWAGFGVIHWLKIGAIVMPEGPRLPHDRLDRPLGLAVGMTGGIIASMTGVGVDMMIYALLVLYYRTDLRVAIPTSVILMASTSVIGIAMSLVLSVAIPARTLDIAVLWNWMAAAPVVALGAPLGALVVERIPRKPTLLVVSTLCVGQFFWTLVDQKVGGWLLIATLLALAGIAAAFLWLFDMGHPHARPATGAVSSSLTG